MDGTLSFVFINNGGLGGEGDLVLSDVEGVEHFVEVILPEEPVQRFSE